MSHVMRPTGVFSPCGAGGVPAEGGGGGLHA